MHEIFREYDYLKIPCDKAVIVDNHERLPKGNRYCILLADNSIGFDQNVPMMYLSRLKGCAEK